MNAQTAVASVVDPDRKGVYRLGGLSAFALVTTYLIIIALFVPVYPIPREGQAMLEYLVGKTSVWWAIIGIHALADFLYAALAFSLYEALRGINRPAMLVAAGGIVVSVVLELAITWPSVATLITLSQGYAAASDVQRAAYVAGANYGTAMFNSTLGAFYTIVVPAIGILLIGLVMRKGIFSKSTAYLGMVTGVLGIVSVVGPLFVSALEGTIILTSLLTTVWFLLVGWRLYKLSQQ